MCMYLYIYIYVCIRVYMCVCKMFLQTYTYIYIYMYIHVYICFYISIYVNMYICVYIYTCTGMMKLHCTSLCIWVLVFGILLCLEVHNICLGMWYANVYILCQRPACCMKLHIEAWFEPMYVCLPRFCMAPLSPGLIIRRQLVAMLVHHLHHCAAARHSFARLCPDLPGSSGVGIPPWEPDRNECVSEKCEEMVIADPARGMNFRMYAAFRAWVWIYIYIYIYVFI